MRINSFRSMYPVVLGVPFLHVLTLGLCVFFVKRFFVETYNPDVYFLLFLFLGGLLLCDVLLFRHQLFQRCYLRFQMDKYGLEWYLIRTNRQKLCWSEVRTYGVTGYDRENPPFAFVFFSKDPRENNSLAKKMSLSKQRIVIQVREDTVCLLEQHLPCDMKKLLDSINRKQDCVYRRQKTD